jgi:hypothetical protein
LKTQQRFYKKDLFIVIADKGTLFFYGFLKARKKIPVEFIYQWVKKFLRYHGFKIKRFKIELGNISHNGRRLSEVKTVDAYIVVDGFYFGQPTVVRRRFATERNRRRQPSAVVPTEQSDVGTTYPSMRSRAVVFSTNFRPQINLFYQF